MRKFAMPMLLLAGCLLFVPGDAAQAQKKKKAAKLAPYVHTVIFYIKKDAPKDAVKAVVADCHKLLADIPSVRGMEVGPPAKTATPGVAVTDYQVGLLCLFDDAAGLKIYLEHPQHLEFVKRHKDKFDKVLVYDFVNQK